MIEIRNNNMSIFFDENEIPLLENISILREFEELLEEINLSSEDSQFSFPQQKTSKKLIIGNSFSREIVETFLQTYQDCLLNPSEAFERFFSFEEGKKKVSTLLSLALELEDYHYFLSILIPVFKFGQGTELENFSYEEWIEIYGFYNHLLLASCNLPDVTHLVPKTLFEDPAFREIWSRNYLLSHEVFQSHSSWEVDRIPDQIRSLASSVNISLSQLIERMETPYQDLPPLICTWPRFNQLYLEIHQRKSEMTFKEFLNHSEERNPYFDIEKIFYPILSRFIPESFLIEFFSKVSRSLQLETKVQVVKARDLLIELLYEDRSRNHLSFRKQSSHLETDFEFRYEAFGDYFYYHQVNGLPKIFTYFYFTENENISFIFISSSKGMGQSLTGRGKDQRKIDLINYVQKLKDEEYEQQIIQLLPLSIIFHQGIGDQFGIDNYRSWSRDPRFAITTGRNDFLKRFDFFPLGEGTSSPWQEGSITDLIDNFMTHSSLYIKRLSKKLTVSKMRTFRSAGYPIIEIDYRVVKDIFRKFNNPLQIRSLDEKNPWSLSFHPSSFQEEVEDDYFRLAHYSDQDEEYRFSPQGFLRYSRQKIGSHKLVEDYLSEQNFFHLTFDEQKYSFSFPSLDEPVFHSEKEDLILHLSWYPKNGQRKEHIFTFPQDKFEVRIRWDRKGDVEYLQNWFDGELIYQEFPSSSLAEQARNFIDLYPFVSLKGEVTGLRRRHLFRPPSKEERIEYFWPWMLP